MKTYQEIHDAIMTKNWGDKVTVEGDVRGPYHFYFDGELFVSIAAFKLESLRESSSPFIDNLKYYLRVKLEEHKRLKEDKRCAQRFELLKKENPDLSFRYYHNCTCSLAIGDAIDIAFTIDLRGDKIRAAYWNVSDKCIRKLCRKVLSKSLEKHVNLVKSTQLALEKFEENWDI